MSLRITNFFHRWVGSIFSLPTIASNSIDDDDDHHHHPSMNQNGHLLSDMAPTLPITIFQPNPNLQIAYDARTRTPVYALERIVVPVVVRLPSQQQQQQQQHVSANHRRRPHFYEELSLPEMFRSRNSHYKFSGYDRGHMAPAADFDAMDGTKQQKDTFVLTNICPQQSTLNRTLWASLEGWVRRVAATTSTHEFNDDDDDNNNNSTATTTTNNSSSSSSKMETYVVTGPLWLPTIHWGEYQYPAIGTPPTIISVPTHFFKVIIVVVNHHHPTTTTTIPTTTKTITTMPYHNSVVCKFACFVIPNQEPDPKKQLHDYLVQWSDLETVLGMQLFPKQCGDKEWKECADALTQDVWELHPSNNNKNVKKMNISNTNDAPQSLLLLTASSGNQQQGNNSSLITVKKKRKNMNFQGLQHLCKSGVCK